MTVASFRHDVRLSSFGEPDIGSLAAALPKRWVAVSPSHVDVLSERVSSNPSQDAEVCAALVASDRSVRLYHLDHVPAWREGVEHLREAVEELCPDVEQIDVALFVAPSGAVTPAHPDRHHNLFLQLQGTKRVWVQDLAATPAVAHHRAVVEYFRPGGSTIGELPPAQEVVLRPGEGVYIPPTAYHWTVVEGEERSVSISVGFRDPRTHRLERSHRLDARLHRAGWRTRPPGAAKRLLFAALDAARARRASCA